MKKIKLFALAVMAMLSTNAFADTEDATSLFRFTYDGSGNATIIGFVASPEAAKVKDLEIPATLPTNVATPAEVKVVAIKAEAFKGNTEIETLKIADTNVATIGGGAFAGCTNLTTVTIGKAVTVIDNATTFSAVANSTALTIGNVYYTAAAGATRYLQTAAYTTTSATDRYTAATTAGAFAGCTKLATVTFNAAAATQQIADGTFIGTAITNLDLTNTKVARVERLFTDGGSNKTNAKLAEVTFPAVMGAVVADAFNGCSALATVNFVTPTVDTQAINAGAFAGTAITTFDLTNSKVQVINQLFTVGTTGSNATLTTVKLAKATTTIDTYAFSGCAKLSKIEWATEGGLTTINGNAFNVTPTLTSLELPATVTTLNNGFLAGSSITSLTINSHATAGPAIGVSGSTKLKTLTVKGAFKGTIAGTAPTLTAVPNLTTLTAGSIYYTATAGAGKLVAAGDEVADGTNYFVIANDDDAAKYAFGSLESVTFEGNVEGAHAIQGYAFGGVKLNTVTFKGTIATNAIDAYAFADATKLATVTFEKKVNATAVAEAAFDLAGFANTPSATGIKMTVNYKPATTDEVATAFDVATFAAAATPRYVAFVTTTTYGPTISGLNAVSPVFDAPAKEYTVENNGSGDWYYAKFYEGTPYSIAKEQESGAKVIVYGAYVDNKDGNIYMEQLHIINGMYQIPAKKPVIIKSNTADKVKAVSGITVSSLLMDNTATYATNEISYLTEVTVGQILNEKTNDKDAEGRPYNNAAANGYNVYALGKISKYNITWKKFGDATQLPVGTFYIHCKKSAAADRLNVVWLDGSEDSATAIKTVKSANAENGAIYNLAGQKVNAAYKGVVIKDGKKYIQK